MDTGNHSKKLLVLFLVIAGFFVFPAEAKALYNFENSGVTTNNKDNKSVQANDPTDYIFEFGLNKDAPINSGDEIVIFFTNDQANPGAAHNNRSFDDCSITATSVNPDTGIVSPLFFDGDPCATTAASHFHNNQGNPFNFSDVNRDFFQFRFEGGNNVPGGSKIKIVFKNVVVYSDQIETPSEADEFAVQSENYNPSDGDNQDLTFYGGTGCGAGDFGCWGLSLFNQIGGFIFNALAEFLSVVLNFFTKMLIYMASFLIGGATFVNTQFVDNMNNNPTAEAAYIGFNIMLGLTNIGFIIAIIVIAFATMFRRQNFGLSVLPRLIIIALIINFSMFIAVSVINVSNQVAGGLSSIVSGQGNDNWAETFNNFFTNVSSDGKGSPEASGGEFGAAVSKLIKVLMAFIMGMLAFFVLVATAIMLIIRYLFLTFLIILLPLALLSKIFPNLKTPDGGNHWNTWQSKFTEWVIFYPIVMLFISIAVYMATWFTTEGQSLSDNPGYGVFADIIQSVIVCGIMVGGILVAKKFGLAGAGYANNVASWATRRITGKAAGLGLRGIGRLGRGVKNVGGAVKQGVVDRGSRKALDLQRPAVPEKGGVIDMQKDASGVWKMGGASETTGAVKGTVGGAVAGAVSAKIDVGAGTQLPPGTIISAPGAVIQTDKVGGAGTGLSVTAVAGAGAIIGGMKGPEQPAGGQPEEGAPTKGRTFGEAFLDPNAKIGDIWKAARTDMSAGVSKRVDTFKEKAKKLSPTTLGEKVDKWGKSGPGFLEITREEIKKHKGPFAGLLAEGKGFKKKEDESKEKKEIAELAKKFKEADSKISYAQAEIEAIKIVAQKRAAKAAEKLAEAQHHGDAKHGAASHPSPATSTSGSSPATGGPAH